MDNVLLVGGGYVASALADRLLAAGTKISIIKRYPCEVAKGVSLILADITKSIDLTLDEEFDAVVYSLSPDEHTEEAYQLAYVDGVNCILSLLRKNSSFRGPFLFTSSTGVYAQSNGEWVDEESPAEPQDFSGNVILEGETILRESEFSTLVLRLGGIYGPGRDRLISDVKAGAAHLSPAIRYSNRIHRDDAAGILFHLLATKAQEGTFLGVDSEPADRNEVIRWLAAELSAPDPVVDEERSHRHARGSKRCSNKKILESGYKFEYPSFREGYRALIEL